MKDEYRLIGHGNSSTRFIKDHDDIYKIDFGNWDDHYRIGYETDWKVDPIYVDPPGGPFINVGYKSDNIEVVKLFYDNDNGGFKVQLKEI